MACSASPSQHGWARQTSGACCRSRRRHSVREDVACRATARRLLAAAAPAALAALTPHATVEVGGENATEESSAASEPGGAEWWRRRLLTSHEQTAYGPLQLQRTLRLLSGRVPSDATSHARLLATCGSAYPLQLRELVRVEPQLGAWWSVMEAARNLVNSRLRSPFGGPAQTFEGLDRMLSSALPTDKAAGGLDASSLERLRLILHSLEQLERQIHNACDGSLALPPPAKTARLFFLNNRRVCFDWFARIRPRLLAAALATRQPASAVRHAQLRLVDLSNRAVSLCTREANSLKVTDGQLKQVQTVLRDAEWTMFVLSDALLELGGTQALDGIAAYSKRKLGMVHAAALKAQEQKSEEKKPKMQVMQTRQQKDAAAEAAKAEAVPMVRRYVGAVARWAEAQSRGPAGGGSDRAAAAA